MAELTQALVLLVHFHGLASFVFACGSDCDDGDEARPTLHYCDRVIPVHDFMTEGDDSDDDDQNTSSEDDQEAVSRTSSGLSFRSFGSSVPAHDVNVSFEELQQIVADLPAASPRDSPVFNMDINVFIEEPDFSYIDFFHKDRTASTFRANDFSWLDKGYSLVNVYYHGAGEMLDKKFDATRKLKPNIIVGDRPVDHSAFHRAIWYYILSLYGIKYDDYNYAEVNNLVDRDLKTFIKDSVCYPELLTLGRMQRALASMSPKARVYVNILIMEARIQGELLYATRALSSYLSTSAGQRVIQCAPTPAVSCDEEK